MIEKENIEFVNKQIRKHNFDIMFNRKFTFLWAILILVNTLLLYLPPMAEPLWLMAIPLWLMAIQLMLIGFGIHGFMTSVMNYYVNLGDVKMYKDLTKIIEEDLLRSAVYDNHVCGRGDDKGRDKTSSRQISR